MGAPKMKLGSDFVWVATFIMKLIGFMLRFLNDANEDGNGDKIPD